MDMSIQRNLGASADKGAIVLREYLASNYAHLHRRLWRHLGCADMAGDCLHDAWLRLGASTVPSAVHSPEAYVFRVACNVAIDGLLQCASEADAALEQMPDHAPGPAAVAEARSELADMAGAIQRLPRRHQNILADLRINELTRDEVALRYGLSLRSVDTALRQALDYCAQQTGRTVDAGVRAPRRALPQQRLGT